MQGAMTTHATWRDWLARFKAEASTQGFADYVHKFDQRGREAPPSVLTAPLYGHVVNARRASAEVRGVGLLEGVAPADWAPPADRAEEEDWDDEDFVETDDVDDFFTHDRRRSPVQFAPPLPREPLVNAAQVGRNDHCPCGSGKKYKHCHGKVQ